MSTRRARAGLTGALCISLLAAILTLGPSTASAVSVPPPNPSDKQIGDSETAATNSAALVGTLAGQVTTTEGDIQRLQDDEELKGELYKKSVIDEQIAQAAAVDAQNAAVAARIAASNAGDAITLAQDKAAEFAAASFRQGSVLGSMTALMGAGSATDLLQRSQLLNQISASQLDVIANLETARNQKANLDAQARQAADAAQAAKAAAVQAGVDAQTALKAANDSFLAGQGELKSLQSQLATEQAAYLAASTNVSSLKAQREQYNQWLAAKQVQEAQLQALALAKSQQVAAAKSAQLRAAALAVSTARAANVAAAKASHERVAAKRAADELAARIAAAKARAAKLAAEKAAAEQAARVKAAAEAAAAAQAKAAADQLAAERKAQALLDAEQAAKNAPANVYYATCADAAAAGVAPISKGSPGYRIGLDSNGNGIACETLSSPVQVITQQAPTQTQSPSPTVGSGGWTAAKGQAAVAAAVAEVGVPYSWGGGNSRGPTLGICGPDGAENDCNVVGFDCSGLTSYAWAQEGVSIPNYSVYQYTLGQHVSIADLLPGDLLFYANDTSNPSSIHHVTMYIGNGQMVEAPYSGVWVRVTAARFYGQYIGATRPGT